MKSIDREVIETAVCWHGAGDCIWLCTVLSTYGSSPRPPGSLFVARSATEHVGSLSGGCVEEAFLEELEAGRFQSEAELIRYGDGGEDSHRLGLPCGGVLQVLVERLAPAKEVGEHLKAISASLSQQISLSRLVSLNGERSLASDSGQGPAVEIDGEMVRIRVGPVSTLLIAGISPVAVYCAQFALALGFEVVVCDPREDALQRFDVPGARVEPTLPSLYIAMHGCHSNAAVVALTHDPKIDDLAMLEAVRTDAFYIGVMGSERTSTKRAERLARIGGLSDEEIARIHMPIGLSIGSKTPSEIALSVMADIVRVKAGLSL